MGEKDKEIIGHNIKYLRKEKGFTQQELADRLGIRRASIGAYEECRATPRYSTIEKMSDLFDITIDDIVRKDLREFSLVELREQNKQLAQDYTGKHVRVLPITTDRIGRQFVDFVSNQKAAAGYLNGFADPEYIEELPKFYLPNMGPGSFRAFEISGDSMLPLQSGTIIVAEYVENWLDIKNGQTYVVVSDSEGVVYKRVFSNVSEQQGGSLTLKSDNTNYSPFDIDIQDVRELWKAKMFLSSEFPEPDMSLEKLQSMVMDLQQEVIKMKKGDN